MALAKRSHDEPTTMPPPPAPKRIKRGKVLDEEVYQQCLSDIIKRDYFPGLAEMELQNDFLTAMDSKDRDRIRQASKDLSYAMTPRPGRYTGRGTNFTTPRGSRMRSTPGITPRTNNDFAPEGPSESPQIEDMSLSQFVQQYTSEDNESAYKLLDNQNAQHAKNNAFYHHGNNIPSKQLMLSRKTEQQMIRDSNGSSNALVKRSNGTTVPPPRPSQDLATRTASLDNFPNAQGAKNHFFFDPEGIEDHTVTIAQAAEERSIAPPQAIQRSATRLQAQTEAPEPTRPSSPTTSAVDAAIAGRPNPTRSELSQAGGETPRVGGYAFVDSEPTQQELDMQRGIPVTDEEADAVEEAAARALLPQFDGTGPNPFRIQNRGKRDETLDRAVERIDAQKRKGGQGNRISQLQGLGIVTPGGKTPTPSFVSAKGLRGRKGTPMTPAGRSLAESMSVGTPRAGGGFGSFGRVEGRGGWTPAARKKGA